jgi:sulfatase modifying factor 1
MTAAGMVSLPGGRFIMGSDRHYPEEGPAHPVSVNPFAIDATPVTNAQFAAFVAATGYRTIAETPPDPAQYPAADPALLFAGSLVFRPTARPVPLDDPRRWWQWAKGACWHAPEGPGSRIDARMDHPVVHIAHADAAAYAAWAGKALPSEAEWEYAARGGLEGAAYAWGDVFRPGGRAMAHTWVGRFPVAKAAGTCAVGRFPANGFGLHDMIGNV